MWSVAAVANGALTGIRLRDVRRLAGSVVPTAERLGVALYASRPQPVVELCEAICKLVVPLECFPDRALQLTHRFLRTSVGFDENWVALDVTEHVFSISDEQPEGIGAGHPGRFRTFPQPRRANGSPELAFTGPSRASNHLLEQLDVLKRVAVRQKMHSHMFPRGRPNRRRERGIPQDPKRSLAEGAQVVWIFEQ